MKRGAMAALRQGQDAERKQRPVPTREQRIAECDAAIRQYEWILSAPVWMLGRSDPDGERAAAARQAAFWWRERDALLAASEEAR
jgi:hypothetical protein